MCNCAYIHFKFFNANLVKFLCILKLCVLTIRPGSRLGKSTWGRLERSKSAQVTFVYGQVGFVWHRLFRVKSTSQRKTCVMYLMQPTFIAYIAYFHITCLNHSPKLRLSPFSSNTDYQIRLIVHLWKFQKCHYDYSRLEHRKFFGLAYQRCANRGIYSPRIFTKDRRPTSPQN